MNKNSYLHKCVICEKDTNSDYAFFPLQRVNDDLNFMQIYSKSVPSFDAGGHYQCWINFISPLLNKIIRCQDCSKEYSVVELTKKKELENHPLLYNAYVAPYYMRKPYMNERSEAVYIYIEMSDNAFCCNECNESLFRSDHICNQCSLPIELEPEGQVYLGKYSEFGRDLLNGEYKIFFHKRCHELMLKRGLISKGCFIATAAAGECSYEVATLQKFRDTLLRDYILGRAFINTYERLSPSIADIIRQNNWMKLLARGLMVRPACTAAKALMEWRKR